MDRRERTVTDKAKSGAPLSQASAGAKHLMVLAESSFAVQQILGYAEQAAEDHAKIRNMRLLDPDGNPVPPQEGDTLRMQIVRLAAQAGLTQCPNGERGCSTKDTLTALHIIADTLKGDDIAYANALKTVLGGAQIAVAAQRTVDLSTLAEREAVPYDLITKLYDPESGCDERQVAKILELPLEIVIEAINGESARRAALGLDAVEGEVLGVEDDDEDDEDDGEGV